MLYAKDFVFVDVKFKNRHYSDVRAGAPMNYLAILLKGSAEITAEDKTIKIKEGDVFYIPKNLGYQSYWHGDKNGEIRFLSFGFQSLFVDISTYYELQTVVCPNSTKERILDILSESGTVDCKTLSRFYDVMDEITSLLIISDCGTNKRTAEKIKNCIRENPSYTIPEIAKLCAISEPFLYNVFKKSFHMTPNEYRQKILCETAAELLISTNKQIEEISSILNFSSASYFRKIMKKHTGKTPGEIRKERGF